MTRLTLYSLAIELTWACNLRCSHCYNPLHISKSLDSSTDRLLERIDKIFDAVQVGHITLTGGEPLSYPRLFEVLAALKRHGVPCQMISNGTLLDAAYAKRLVEAKLRGIQISLHGPDAQTHEDYTRTQGSFERAVAGVQAANQAGLHVTGCIVVTRRNAHWVGATLGLWQKLGVQRVALSRFSPSGLASQHVARLLPSIAELMTAFEQATPYARGGMRLFCTMPIPPCAMDTKLYAPIRFGSCAVGTTKQEFALSPGGALRFCTLHTQAIGGVEDILDVEDVSSLFHHGRVVTYREGAPSFCGGCYYERSCGGGCGAASMSVYGHREQPDPLLWQHVDDAFREGLDRQREGG